MSDIENIPNFNSNDQNIYKQKESQKEYKENVNKISEKKEIKKTISMMHL